MNMPPLRAVVPYFTDELEENDNSADGRRKRIF